MRIARVIAAALALLSVSCRAPAPVVDETFLALAGAFGARGTQPPSAAEMRVSPPRRVIHADGRVTWDVVVYRWCDSATAWITVGRLELPEDDVACACGDLEYKILGNRAAIRFAAQKGR